MDGPGIETVLVSVYPWGDEMVTLFMMATCLDGGYVLTDRLSEVVWDLDLDLVVVDLMKH